MEHQDYVTPKITDFDKQLLKNFNEENKISEGFSYRKGASFTTQFGIEEGWGPNWKDGFVRVHIGVDRAGGGTINTVKDVIISPFNFDSTRFIDYNGESYGTLMVLLSKKYQFEMRIAHMNPKTDVIPWALSQFKAGNKYEKGWLIGSAGNYGFSKGAHTHTELKSLDDVCEMFELLLLERHGDKSMKEYTNDDIVNFYRSQVKKYPNTSPYGDWTNDQILKDWLNQKIARKIFFINQFKCCYLSPDNNKPVTSYATNGVFDNF